MGGSFNRKANILTLQHLKMTQRRSIYSLRAISQGVFNLHMDRHLQKPVRNQCMNGTIHWRPTIECCRCASYDGRGLGKSFCQCLCDERKKHSNGKSRELHSMDLISEMGFFRWYFCPFFAKLLIPSLERYWKHFLRRHSCVRFYQYIHLVPDIFLSNHFITHDQGY